MLPNAAAVLVLSALFLSGCTYPVRTSQMTTSLEDVKTSNLTTPLRSNVLVSNVSGGKTQDPLGATTITNTKFQQALMHSLDKSGLWAKKGKAAFELNAAILSVDIPYVAIDFTATVIVRYRLKHLVDGEIFFDQKIVSSHTKKGSETFMGAERFQGALEGAVFENIAELINRLYALDLPQSKSAND